MILLTTNTPILLATKPADFSYGIDSFVAICRHQLAQEPRSDKSAVAYSVYQSQTML